MSDKPLDSIVSCIDEKKSFCFNSGAGSGKTYNLVKTIGNLFISTQSVCNGYYPMSFEEAVILANPDSEIVCKALMELHPSKYENWKGALSKNSHTIQRCLSGDKGAFAASVLYNMVSMKDKEPELVIPRYIADGLIFIKQKLNPSEDEENV